MVERTRRKAIVKWERRLAEVERRERATIIAGLVAGPVLVVLLSLGIALVLHAWFPRAAEARPLPFGGVFGFVAGIGSAFGILTAGVGQWKKLTLGESIDEAVEQAATQQRVQGGDPFTGALVMILLIGCTCGAWLVFDAFARLWTGRRLRNACRWRAAAVMATLTPTGRSVTDLLHPGESAEQPGRLGDVLRYLVIRQWIAAESRTATIYPQSPSMRDESWLDAIRGVPAA